MYRGVGLKLNKIVPIAFAILVGVTMFQNCGRMSSLKNDASSESPQYGGNGSGYDGKVFVHLNDQAPCADGGLFDARLEGRGGRIFLTRQNCTDIPQALQTAVQIETTPLSPTVVIYEGRVYHERILLIDDSAAGLDNTRFLGGNGFTVDQNGVLNGTVGVLARYKPDGTPDWMKTSPELTASIKNFGTMPSGDIVMVTTRLDNTAGIFKLNGQGVPQWARAVARSSNYNASYWFSSVASDAAKNIYLAGGLEDATSKSSGVFVMKLDPNGALLWTRTILPAVGTPPTAGPHSQSSAVTVVSATGIFVKGNLKGIPVVARLNEIGEYYWLKTYPGFKSGFGAVHRPNHTTALSLNDTSTSLIVEVDALGNEVSARRLTPPAGFTTAFLGYLLLSPDGTTTAAGYIGTTTRRSGIVLVRDANNVIKSQWQISIGIYSPVEFPKLGPDGIVWAEAHVPFAAGGLLTSIMLRFDPAAPAPTCAFCSVPSLQLTPEAAPSSTTQGSLFSDQFLTITPTTNPVFTDIAPGTFAY